MEDRILALIERAMDEINPILKEPVAFRSDLILLGSSGVLDSLGLVNLMSVLEELLEDEYKKEIRLVTDKAFSRGASPFYSVETLCSFIENLLQGTEE